MNIAQRLYITMALVLADHDRKENEKGAVMVEYGLLVAFIALIALAGVTLLGTRLLALFNGITF